MRPRLVLTALVVLALLLPAASQAVQRRGDGTLSIQNGRGTVVVQARGAVIGQLTRLERNGSLVIEDQDELDGSDPRVLGADWVRARADGTPVYGGKGIRFRVIGGRFTLRVTNAVGLQLSVVGRGKATLDGAGTASDGVYSLNGEAPQALPPFASTLLIQPPKTAARPPR